MEIPLEGDAEEPETLPNNSENVLEKIEEEPNGNEEIVEGEENVEPPEETPEIVEEAPAPKRPRGRPKGSTKPKVSKPPEQPKQLKPKKAPKKAPKKVVQYESSDEEEELPDYVRQEVRIPRAQQPPSQSELAANMLRYLQEQHTARVQQKNDLYDSWFQHYY